MSTNARRFASVAVVVGLLVLALVMMVLKSNDFEEVAVQAVKENSALKAEVKVAEATEREARRRAMATAAKAAEAAKAEVPVVPVVPVPAEAAKAEASVEKTLDAGWAASKAQEAASKEAKALAAKEWREARDAAAAQWSGLYRKAVAWSQRKAAEQAAEEAAAKAATAAPKLEPAPAPAPAPRVIQDPWAEVRAARNWGLAPAPK